MKLNKTLDFALNFGKTATNAGIPPYVLACLIVLADRRANAWTRMNNRTGNTDLDNKIHDKATDELRTLASANGYDVDFGVGLYPEFVSRKDGFRFILPG